MCKKVRRIYDQILSMPERQSDSVYVEIYSEGTIFKQWTTYFKGHRLYRRCCIDDTHRACLPKPLSKKIRGLYK